MDSLGLIIFKNGDSASFGVPVYMDQPGYTTAPGHEECFKREIVPLMKFKEEKYTFNIEESFYGEVITLAKEGLILLLNNKLISTDPERILGYMPSKLTKDQKEVIKEMVDLGEFDGFRQELYEFVDDDPIKYDSLEEYYNSKKVRQR